MKSAEIKAFYSVFGENLRNTREVLGFTQKQLADGASLSRTAIINIEKGKQQVALHHVFAFSRVLGVDLGGLLIKLDYKPSWVTAKIKEKQLDDDLERWVGRLK